MGRFLFPFSEVSEFSHGWKNSAVQRAQVRLVVLNIYQVLG